VQFVPLEPGGKSVVLREVEIDNRKRTGIASPLPAWRTRLQEPPRDVPGLGQQKQTDLSDVRSRRDVDEIILRVGVERIRACEVVKACIVRVMFYLSSLRESRPPRS
jgi:hypothetical protein